MANRVKKEGRRKRAGAKIVGNLGSKTPPGRAKGGSHRVGRTGIPKPSMHAAKRGEKSAPMFNAMRANPPITASTRKGIAGRQKKDSPKVIDKLYSAMRGDGY